jgi:hypothetical protein
MSLFDKLQAHPLVRGDTPDNKERNIRNTVLKSGHESQKEFGWKDMTDRQLQSGWTYMVRFV